MNKSTILIILLIASFSFNVYQYITCSDDDSTGDCVVTPGYDRPQTLSDEEVQRFNESYMSTRPSDDEIKGGIITRTALEEIMCQKGVNAITYMLCNDPEGKAAGKNSNFIVLSGAHATYDSETRTIVSVEETGCSRYIPRHWCPPSCMKLNP